jgi:hypothetical protein
MAAPKPPPMFGSPPPRRGFICGIGVNLAELASNALFYNAVMDAPRGSIIRPMTLPALLLCTALSDLIVGVQLCVADAVAAFRMRRRSGFAYAVVGLILTLAALPLAFTVSQFIVHSRGLVLAD